VAKSKRKIIDEVGQKAKEAEVVYSSCARSVLYGLKQHFDFLPDEMIRAASSLSAGCGSSGGSCGAYSGGLLAIGFQFNPSMGDLSQEGLKKRDIARKKRTAFREAFLAEFGTTMCPEIQEKVFGRRFKLWEEKEWQEFLNHPEHGEKCGDVVGKAARMAAKIMLEE
jgi:C_GCAxxG_C_C family probable redox protein